LLIPIKGKVFKKKGGARMDPWSNEQSGQDNHPRMGSDDGDNQVPLESLTKKKCKERMLDYGRLGKKKKESDGEEETL